ncbi:nucleoside 2-deoxyribosyltransferase [Cereibacter sphaeroides]|uniref:nucleoside 2-deoxyribosyltransferase n=1 Tax=Cereibacter sphaeroides TaxID=1063 RepID=UPI001D0EEB7F|nr:nucleoside 2-deoxyribosyltransferase [Cereibacter sphaeroides]
MDFTLSTPMSSAKMRLGGVVHAARGLWALNVPYSVAAICPDYLVSEAEAYLYAHGCTNFIQVGTVLGAPNVFLIGDAREVGHQGYENILREAKKVLTFDLDEKLRGFKNIVVYPGTFDFEGIVKNLDSDAKITVDIAYDVNDADELSRVYGASHALAISTSSELFSSLALENLGPLLKACKTRSAKHLLLKENRGGSRLFDLESGESWEIPATLARTVNSVGVGDVYTAVFAALIDHGALTAALRGMQAATRYAQTTFPDDFKRDVQRDFKLTPDEVLSLGGVLLPWHDRPHFEIYLAAPDFSYMEKAEVDAAVEALLYHNFTVRRPVQDNGEACPGTPAEDLRSYYDRDVELLRRCSLVFAVPLNRDPGTLVEIGLAIAAGTPVVTYDPRQENNNTMVICGSDAYSDDLDQCLNSTFELLAKLREQAK